MDQQLIRSEEEAWEVLGRLLAGRILDDTASAYELGDWAQLSVDIKGQKYRSSLTPRLMQGLLTFNNNVTRTFALTAYGRADARAVDREEQEALQLVFYVGGGSTAIKAKLKRSYSVEVTIPPRLALMTTIVVALAYGGAIAIKSYFESNAGIQREHLRLEQSREETRRLELFKDALRQLQEHNIQSQLIADMARSSYVAIIKSLPDAESVDIAGIPLSRDQMDDILDTDPDSDQFPRTMAGRFTVRGLKNTLPNKYFLNLERGQTKIRASYNPTQLDQATIARIAEALLNKSDMELRIRLTGRYRSQLNGTIISFD